MITTKSIAAEPIQPILERENRVKLTADIQKNHVDSLLTVAKGETGTIVGHHNEFVRIKLDFNPLDRYSPKPFELEVLPSQITLIDPNILISPELKCFIPPLSYDEREKLLHNLQLNGCREPLVVWEGRSILLDGHNRFELCTKYEIEYKIVEVRLPSFESAYSWIVSNQLGRRNLTPEAMSYLRGKLYNLEKQHGKRKDLTGGQNDPKLDNLTGGQNDEKLETENLTGGQNGTKLETENLTGGQNGTKLETENLTGGQNGHKLDDHKLAGGQNDHKLDDHKLAGGQNDHKLDEDNLAGGQNGHKLVGGQNDHKLAGGQNGHKLDEDNLAGGQNGHKLVGGQNGHKLAGGQNDHKLDEDKLVGGQSDHQLKTATKIAQKYKVGERTIRRDAKFALAVDKLANTVGDDVRKSILSRDANLTKKKTLELAKKAEREPDKVKEKFVEGRYVSSAKPYEFTPFPYQVGEVVRVSGKNEPQLRGFGGCWAIITAVHHFSGDIQMWNGTATNLHREHLSSLDYNPSQCESKKQLSERITKIIEQSPEATAMQFLSILGKQRSPELTQLEEKMLNLLETEYGVETAEPQSEEPKTAEAKFLDASESEPQPEDTKESQPQPENTKESEPQPENSPNAGPQSQAPKVPLLKRTPIDDIPPSREYNDIIKLIDLHMKELGWDKDYGRKFLKRTYGKTSRQLLLDDELLGFLNHLKYLYSPEELHEECEKYTQDYIQGKTVCWCGKEYKISYVRGDLNRIILLSLSGDDVGERYTVHPIEIRRKNN